MRILAVAAALLALAALPAQAQMGRHGTRDDNARTEPKGPKIDEKAYNDALKRIPEPKDKYDPWSGARPPTDQKQAR